MSTFVRSVFLLVILSSVLAFGLVVASNARSAEQRDKSLDVERGLVAACLQKLDHKPSRAVLTVERQETRMDPDTQASETASTTLLFGLTDADFHAPTYVQRIVISGDVVRVSAITLTFTEAMPEEQRLLASRQFFLFDTISGTTGNGDVFGLNAVGYPPLALRHDSPVSTDFENQLWRPVWDVVQSSRTSTTVKREVWSPERPRLRADQQVQVGRVYKLFAWEEGVRIEPAEDNDLKWAILKTAQEQDAEAATGEKKPVGANPRQ